MEYDPSIEEESSAPAKLFVGQIPKDIMENTLSGYFEEYGSIKEVSIIRDISTGMSKGCAFVIYYKHSAAVNAVNALNNKVKLPHSVNNLQVRFAETQVERENKLFVGMLPKTFTEQELKDLFSPYGELKEVHIIRGSEGGPKGCAFVKFVQRDSAIAAMDDLNETIPNGATRPLVVKFADSKKSISKSPDTPVDSKMNSSIMWYGRDVIGNSQFMMESPVTLAANVARPIFPAFPLTQPVSGQIFDVASMSFSSSFPQQILPQLSNRTVSQSQPKLFQEIPKSSSLSRPPEGPAGANLFIYHLPRDLTDADLATLFAPFGNVISAKVFVDKKTSDSKGFGFVSYDSFESAKSAIDSMNGFQIGTKRLKVQHKRIVSSNQPGDGEKGFSHVSNFESDNTPEKRPFAENIRFDYPQDSDFRR